MYSSWWQFHQQNAAATSHHGVVGLSVTCQPSCGGSDLVCPTPARGDVVTVGGILGADDSGMGEDGGYRQVSSLRVDVFLIVHNTHIEIEVSNVLGVTVYMSNCGHEAHTVVFVGEAM